MSAEYYNIYSESGQLGQIIEIHNELSDFLGDKQTFSDYPGALTQNIATAIEPFDILVYAYLKEELINCANSNESKHLQKQKNLMKFVKFMDQS